MMRLLGADSGARQSLFHLMELPDIARLHSTGRSWRSWIAEAPFVGARAIDIAGDQHRDPSRCPWLRRSAQHLQYEDRKNIYYDAGEGRVAFDQLLLLHWSRLRSIKATFHLPLPSAELLRASLVSVAATLQRLDVTLYHYSAPARSLLLSVHSLHQLESLTIDAAYDELIELDLSALPVLPRLQQFALRLELTRPCSLAQMDALARCKALTDLECGQWLPKFIDIRSMQLTDAQLQQIEDGLGRLIHLRKENGAAPLRRLNLGNWPMILPPCWRVLSQFTTLETIAAHWSCTLTAADWMLLATFPQLHTLTIRELERANIGETSHALLDLGLVFPSLVHCRALRSLDLDGGFDLRTEHAALVAQIPSLESLSVQRSYVESLEPLSHAPVLMELFLSYCDGPDGESINTRAMIPPMPLVSKLTIRDDYRSRLSASEAEPFNVALLARLPKLTPDRFVED